MVMLLIVLIIWQVWRLWLPYFSLSGAKSKISPSKNNRPISNSEVQANNHTSPFLNEKAIDLLVPLEQIKIANMPTSTQIEQLNEKSLIYPDLDVYINTSYFNCSTYTIQSDMLLLPVGIASLVDDTFFLASVACCAFATLYMAISDCSICIVEQDTGFVFQLLQQRQFEKYEQMLDIC